MPQLIPSRTYYAMYLYILLRYKYLQNNLFNDITFLHKEQILKDLRKLQIQNFSLKMTS